MSNSKQRSKWGWVLFFLAPSLIGLVIFIIYPILSSLWYAFHEWDLLSPPVFNQLDNFNELLGDDKFWSALHNTLKFILLYVPSVFILGLALAIFLNQKLHGMIMGWHF